MMNDAQHPDGVLLASITTNRHALAPEAHRLSALPNGLALSGGA